MKTKNRYLILVAAAIVNFVYGAAYIWTVFQPAAIEQFHLPMASANRPFNVFMGSFVIGNIIGGKLQQKIGARNTILLGSGCMVAGFFATANVPVQMAVLVNLTYGIMGGGGAGAAYNALIAAVQKWFPDKRGMVSGITICTVGAPGLVMTPLCNNWIASYGFSKAMMMVAILYTVMCFGLGWMIIDPPKDYHVAGTTKTANDSQKNYRTGEIIHMKQFYLMTASMMFATMAYFLINPMMKSLGMERGLSQSAAISAVMIGSVLNVAGRLVAPWVSDKIERKTMLILLFVVSISAVLGLTVATGPIFILGVALICFSYGGFFGIFPVLSSDYFGSKYAGMNYGVIMIGYGVISLLCPTIVAMGVKIAFVIAALGGAIGIICSLLLKKPE